MIRNLTIALQVTCLLLASSLASGAKLDSETDSDSKTFRSSPGLRLADPDVLERLREIDLRNPGLPRHLAAEELRQRTHGTQQSLVPLDLPDYAFLRTAAEYEANRALLMRWGQFNAVLTSMIVPITTGDSRARVKLIVANQSQQNSAAAALSSAGANLDRVRFIQASSNSVWIRDYGPRFAFGNFGRIIIDHTYDRPRPLDNAIPAALAGELELSRYLLPLAQGGGNYHSFSYGEAFITEHILRENPTISRERMEQHFAAYQGVDLSFFGTLSVDPNGNSSGGWSSWYDGTGHLDMWFLPVDDETVIIGQYSPSEWNGIPHQVSEEAVVEMTARGYTVLRTPGWRASGTHFTYTNAVIVNDLVLVCTFNGYPTQNAAALSTFEQAFPDRTIIQLNCSDIIGAAGALHCIVKHMPFDERQSSRPPYYGWPGRP